MIKKCPKCGGAKKYLAIGSLMKECDMCKGVGHIDEILECKSNNVELKKNEHVDDGLGLKEKDTVKKKGRPRKVHIV